MKKTTKRFLSILLTMAIIFGNFAGLSIIEANAAAGSYYVKLTWAVTSKNNLNATYGGYNKEVNDSGGISIQYKNNNGSDSAVQTKNYDIGNNSSGTAGGKINTNGNYTLTDTLSGFPTLVYAYIDDDRWLFGNTTFQITKIEVGSSSSGPLTTLWEGTLKVDSTSNPYAASVALDGTTKADYFNSDSATYVNTSTINWNSPVATTKSLTGASSIKIPTNGAAQSSTYSASATDQYGVKWSDPTWSDSSSNTSLTSTAAASKAVTFSNASADYNTTITANFDGQTATKSVSVKVPHTITYDLNGGTYANSSEIKYTGDTITLGTPTKPGHEFVGWTASSGTISGSTYTVPNGNATVTANWNTTQYDINFDANGGTVDPTSLTYDIYSTSLSLPVPTRAAYTFAGWTVSSANGNWNANETVTSSISQKYGSITAKANWTPIDYTVNIDANGGSGDTSQISYNAQTTELSLPSLTKPNYTFTGWTVSVAGGNWSVGEHITSPISQKYGSITAKANWTPIDYTVNIDANGGSGDTSQISYNVQTTELSLPSLTKPNYTFTGWTVSIADGNWSVGERITSSISQKYGSITAKANWTPIDYTVNIDANGGSGDTSQISYNAQTTELSLPSLTKPNYTFTGWTVSVADGNWSVGERITSPISQKYGNITVKANWAANIHSLGYDDFFSNEEWINGAGSNASYDSQTGIITVNGSTVSTNQTNTASHFPVSPNMQYLLSYEQLNNVANTNSFIYVHFWDASGNELFVADDSSIDYGPAATGVDSGAYLIYYGNSYQNTPAAWGAAISSPDKKVVYSAVTNMDCFADYSSGTFGNAAISFTTPANTSYVTIAVGHSGDITQTQYKNIRLSECKNYTSENLQFGTLKTPEKTGLDFTGWFTDDGTQITDSTSTDGYTQYFWVSSRWTANNSSIVSDKAVIDFGLPVNISVTDNDSILKDYIGKGNFSVSIAGFGTASSKLYKNLDSSYTESFSGSYGTFSANGDNVKYSPSSVAVGSDSVYCAIKIVNNDTNATNYVYSIVAVFPATMVYYEDNCGGDDGLIKYTDGKVAGGVLGDTGVWSTVGTFDNAAVQSWSDLSDSVYGFDDVYASQTGTYSMGSAHTVTVSAKNNSHNPYEPWWPIAQFTFAGTGFDIVSLISNNTGGVEIQVFSGTNTDKEEDRVFYWLVDSFYSYAYNTSTDEWVVSDSATDNSLYQIPIISKSDMDYGTYTVQVRPAYSSRLDHAKDGSYDFFLDAIRIYDPTGVATGAVENAEIQKIYSDAGELVLKNLSFYDLLVSANTLNESGSEGAVYINNKYGSGGIEDYKKVGPKNEVYLDTDQAISFNLTVSQIPSSVQVSAHTANKEAVSMRYATGTGSYSAAVPITSASTLFYTIPSAYLNWTHNSDGTYSTSTPVIISNNGGGLLSLCNLKCTYTNAQPAAAAAPMVMMMMSRSSAFAAAKTAETLVGLTNDDTGLFVPGTVETNTDAEEAVIAGSSVKVTVTTSADVASLTINGNEATLDSVNDDGTKTWSFNYTTGTSTGTETLEVIAYNSDGIASESTEITVNVETKAFSFIANLKKILTMIIEFVKNLAVMFAK